MNCILFPFLFHVKHFSPALYCCQFIFLLLFSIYFIAKLSLLAAILLLSFFYKKILASFLLFFRKLGIDYCNGHNNTAEYFPNSQRLSQKQPTPNRRINGSGGHEKRSKSIFQSLLSIALHGKGHCSGHNSGVSNGEKGCLQTHEGEFFKEEKSQ